MKPELSREDYACLLARYYALCLGKNRTGLFGDPFRVELDKEYEIINAFMNQHKCLESEIVARVRELVPESNWDKGIREVTVKMGELLDSNASNKDFTELNAKLQMYLNEPDWKEREHLDNLFEKY